MAANIHNLIQREYEKRRDQAFDELNQRRTEVFLKIPALQDIENEIHQAGIKYSRMILLGKDSSDLIISKLLTRINQLKKEKEHLILNSGYPSSYLELSFLCSKCSDSGFIQGVSGTEKCSCYNQQLINHLYSQSNLSLTDTENFMSFNENFYPDDENEALYGIKKSPRKYILAIKDKCLKFVENFDSPEEKNLYFCGPTGVGKTFMANCIARELMNSGRTVLYQTAPILFDTISAHKMRLSGDDDFQDIAYKNIFEVELLIIDDLGTEPQSSSRFAEFLNILNTRYINNLSKPCKTIISTNLESDKLYESYGERVESRIAGNFALYKFSGNDIRKVKKQSK